MLSNILPNNPAFIALDSSHNKIYVANSGSNTVSVINATNDKVSHNITVGNNPAFIALDSSHNKTYVANSNLFNFLPPISKRPVQTFSVIDSNNDNEMLRISVGKLPPNEIAVVGTKIYVLDGSNIVSVINATNDKNVYVHKIPVGVVPSHIAVGRMIYLVNEFSDSVSVIDSSSDKVAAGVTLNIYPANSGKIICDNEEYPKNSYLYVDAGTNCVVQPNKDFEFIGWVENLNRNSTIPLSDTSGNLTVNRYGTFTANFKPLPPVIPTEFLYLLVGIILSSLFGWSIPSIMGWVKARRKYLKGCINQIRKLDRNAIEEMITRYHIDGKINESQRQLLKDKISEYYEKVKGSYGSPIKK